MPEGMSKIKNFSQTGFPFIFLYDISFQLTTSLNHGRENDMISFQNLLVIPLDILEEIGIENCAVFYDFRQSTSKFPVRKSFEYGDIDINLTRLMECSEQIFSERMIDGDFSANTAVDLCKKRGWNLYERNSTKQRCRNKSGEITDHASTESDDD